MKPDSITEGDAFTVRKFALPWEGGRGGTGRACAGRRLVSLTLLQVYRFVPLLLVCFCRFMASSGGREFCFLPFFSNFRSFFCECIISLFRCFGRRGGGELFFSIIFRVLLLLRCFIVSSYIGHRLFHLALERQRALFFFQTEVYRCIYCRCSMCYKRRGTRGKNIEGVYFDLSEGSAPDFFRLVLRNDSPSTTDGFHVARRANQAKTND